ncbi:MAG TPA: hypothetical protein DCE25_05275 [Pseudomonas sp.]|nr:hypothetical protein [Pseudomonas sp.]
MRALICGLGIALLAGCVTTADLESNEPSISAETGKNAKQYALCVFPKWQAARTESAMAETESGYRLWVSSGGMTDELLDIVQTPNGSRVTLRQRMAWSPGVGRAAIEKSVKSCL